MVEWLEQGKEVMGSNNAWGVEDSCEKMWGTWGSYDAVIVQ